MSNGTRTILIGAFVIVVATIASFFIRPTLHIPPAGEPAASTDAGANN